MRSGVIRKDSVGCYLNDPREFGIGSSLFVLMVCLMVMVVLSL